MAQLTLATAITQIRDWVQDASTTAQGLSDAQITRLVNNWYLWLYPQGEPRVTGQAAASTGITLSSTFYGVTTPTNYARILGVFAANSATIMTKSIRIVTLNEFYQNYADGVPTPGSEDPTECTMYRQSDGKWVVLFNKSATTQPISMLVELEATDLTGSDPILLRPEETRLVAALSALDAALMLGRDVERPQMIAWLEGMVDRYLGVLGLQNAMTHRPRGVPGRA